jgi:hypothetical protein
MIRPLSQRWKPDYLKHPRTSPSDASSLLTQNLHRYAVASGFTTLKGTAADALCSSKTPGLRNGNCVTHLTESREMRSVLTSKLNTKNNIDVWLFA